MLTSVSQWLAGVGWSAFVWALAALLVLNAGAMVLLASRRNRETVQRYTSMWLAGNLLLVAVGVGVPAVTAVARLALLASSAVLPGAMVEG